MYPSIRQDIENLKKFIPKRILFFLWISENCENSIRPGVRIINIGFLNIGAEWVHESYQLQIIGKFSRNNYSYAPFFFVHNLSLGLSNIYFEKFIGQFTLDITLKIWEAL